MADYENSIFDNLPQRRRGAGVLDDERPSWREVLSMRNFDEGPLPPRPHVSGKGGPSINQGSKPVATSVWSASDAAANGMTLTNGGLTVAIGSTAGSIRTSSSKTTGKFYIEFANSVTATSFTWQLGLANTGFPPTANLGNSNYSAGMMIQTGNNVSTGFTSHYISGLPDYDPPAGTVFALAIDFDAGSVWVADNNVWSNGSNPGTGALPILSFIPTTVGTLFAAMNFEAANEGGWTLQPTPASQKYLPPPGFQAWDGGPVTPSASSVWSASDAAANAMTLSNGGLTVNAASVYTPRSIRGSSSHSSGKWYVEIKNNTPSTNTLIYGISDATFPAAAYLGDANYSFGVDGIGNIANSGSITVNYSLTMSPVANDVIAYAGDFTSGKVWIALNNVWQGGGNPATGVNPIATIAGGSLGLSYFPALTFWTTATDVWTLQPTAASQKYAPPSGFSPWG